LIPRTPFGQCPLMNKRIALAADHAGFELKSALKEELEKLGYSVLDLGTSGPQSVDYPDFADALADALAQGRAEWGLAVCGTGIASRLHSTVTVIFARRSATTAPVRALPASTTTPMCLPSVRG
jgi:ribose/galactose isomerase